MVVYESQDCSEGGKGDEGGVGGGEPGCDCVCCCVCSFRGEGGGMEVETEVGVEDGLDRSCLKGLGFQMGI